MVTLNKIYTRTGDQGETALGSGTRVPKDSLRVAAYGTVDETNATIGLARLHASAEMDQALARIQNDMFDLGADLCRPETQEESPPALRISTAQVQRLEVEIDAINTRQETLKSFILPGGTPLAAHLHLCRTVTRRAERLSVELSRFEVVSPAAIQYLNRLSDWFFVAARAANQNGKTDILWVPGANR